MNDTTKPPSKLKQLNDRITHKIDNSPFVHWYLAISCIFMGATTFWGKNFGSTALFILAGAILMPPLQRNFNSTLEQPIPPKIFMNTGLVVFLIACFIFTKYRV